MKKYPSCLEGTDLAGVVRARTPQTEAAYRRRYEGMERTLTRKRREPHVGVEDVIDNLVGRAAHLAEATYYVYKASVIQVLRDEYDAGRLSASSAQKLTQPFRDLDPQQIGNKVTANRTSAGRRRHIRPEVHASLTAAVLANPHSTAQDLGTMIEYGVDLGLRPCEFIGAELEGTTLWIRAAKVSAVNGRGLDARRPIELLDAFDEDDLKILSALFMRLNVQLQAVNGDRTKLVRRYAAALRRIRGRVRAAKGVTLYTSRHQFRANLARAGYTPAEIAALMGHGSKQTNGDHYGRKNKGWAPVWGARPLEVPSSLTSRVRPGARAKAKFAKERMTETPAVDWPL